MSGRKVRGLISAEALTEAPGNRRGGTSSFAASAGAGLKYERDLALAVARFGIPTKHGQWFKFRDTRGVGFCQTDVLQVIPGERAIVWEAKLTQKSEGEVKLEHLYIPLVKKIFRLPTYGILAFKNILWQPELQLEKLEHAMELVPRYEGRVLHCHWIGVR